MVAAAAQDEVALARELRGQRPDVLVLGYDSARGETLALCRRIKNRPAPLRVLICFGDASPALTVAARAAQADGLLAKTAPPTAHLAAIRRIADGGSVIPGLAREDLAEAVTRLDRTDLPIFAMLLDGKPLPAIAQTLRTDQLDIACRAGEIVERLRPRPTRDGGK